MAAFGNRSDILAQILHNRGFDNEELIQQFIATEKIDRHPERMKGVPIAVKRIVTAIAHQEKIVVYGDYDADGVTATALMIQTLRSLGANTHAYIPHRIREGYGLNNAAIDRLLEEGATLIITVDCGIRALGEVKHAQDRGADVIITDHHSLAESMPPALAIINPRQPDCPYPNKDLAGVGVAFNLAYALLRHIWLRDGAAAYPSIRLSDLLDLVAIGTIADLMPLNNLHNRALVKAGLPIICEGRRPGLRALLNAASIAHNQINATAISFAIAPRINAAGRLDDANLALQLLLCENEEEASRLARQLSALNSRRQQLTSLALEKVQQQLADRDTEHAVLISAGDADFPPGIVGLVAGRLVEEYYRPVVVWSQGEEVSHASCRSIPEFNIVSALDQCSDLFIRYGGHHMAAGFSIKNENLEVLASRLDDLARAEFLETPPRPTLHLDAEIQAAQLSLQLAEDLALLEPTGYSNPPPLFLLQNLKVLEARSVGRDGAHLRLLLKSPPRQPIQAIAFGMGDLLESLPRRIDVAANLESNEWKGQRRLQLLLRDFRPSQN